MSSLSYQILVSTMKQTDFSIYSSMNLNSDAIIVNQGDKNLYEHALICDNDVLMYSFAERGVGLSRNSALMRASADILEFADDDMIFVDGYQELVIEEFEKHPMAMSLSGAFYEKELSYTYEEYTAHLEATKQFAKIHANYHLKMDSAHAFRNIQIQLHKGKWAMVSKTKTPTIHFVIRHSKMLNAFENFIAPVIEPED